MASFLKINDWPDYLANAAQLGSDAFAIALSNTSPGAEASNPTLNGNGLLANVTQIDYTNYTDDLTVDRVLEGVTDVTSGGVLTFSANSFRITAVGGDIASFQYLYLYDDTIAGDPLVAVWDAERTITLLEDDFIDVTVPTSGLFTLS